MVVSDLGNLKGLDKALVGDKACRREETQLNGMFAGTWSVNFGLCNAIEFDFLDDCTDHVTLT